MGGITARYLEVDMGKETIDYLGTSDFNNNQFQLEVRGGVTQVALKIAPGGDNILKSTSNGLEACVPAYVTTTYPITLQNGVVIGDSGSDADRRNFTVNGKFGVIHLDIKSPTEITKATPIGELPSSAPTFATLLETQTIVLSNGKLTTVTAYIRPNSRLIYISNMPANTRTIFNLVGFIS